VTPVKFPEHMHVLAKNQPPFRPLPVWQDDEQTVSQWQMSWSERFRIFFSGRLWLRQVNFGAPLQAQLPSVETPFTEHE
jgi:hypothetical protein